MLARQTSGGEIRVSPITEAEPKPIMLAVSQGGVSGDSFRAHDNNPGVRLQLDGRCCFVGRFVAGGLTIAWLSTGQSPECGCANCGHSAQTLAVEKAGLAPRAQPKAAL